MSKNRSMKQYKRGYHARKIDVLEPREKFLIVCEGERTEPNYFRSFRVSKDVVVEVLGFGYNTVSLIQKAIELQNAHSEEYDQVWCVFDRDSFPAQNFNQALALAKQNKIFVAYSNEAFELWYLLHFHYYDTAVTRRDYCTKLGELLGREYQKNQDDMYHLLLSRQTNALKNAKRLLKCYSPIKPEQNNPSTTVHLLVEQLNRFIR